MYVCVWGGVGGWVNSTHPLSRYTHAYQQMIAKDVFWQSYWGSNKESMTCWQILTGWYQGSPFQPGLGWISSCAGEAYLLWKGLQWPIHSQTGLVAADHVWLGSSKTGLTTLTQVVVAPLVQRERKPQNTQTHFVLLHAFHGCIG